MSLEFPELEDAPISWQLPLATTPDEILKLANKAGLGLYLAMPKYQESFLWVVYRRHMPFGPDFSKIRYWNHSKVDEYRSELSEPLTDEEVEIAAGLVRAAIQQVLDAPLLKPDIRIAISNDFALAKWRFRTLKRWAKAGE